jgi:hypothetical protein
VHREEVKVALRFVPCGDHFVQERCEFDDRLEMDDSTKQMMVGGDGLQARGYSPIRVAIIRAE